MKMTYGILAGLAIAGSAGLFFSGCQTDPSAPSRPKTSGIFSGSDNNDNALKRENEPAKPELPATGSDLPSHSQAAPVEGAKVITADSGFRNGSKLVRTNASDARFPETKYPEMGWYPGPLPTLPDTPGMVPMAGSTPVPGTGWSIDHSWGEVLPLENYPHRDWPKMQATYVAGDVKHDPVYFANIQNRLKVPQNNASYAGNWVSNLYEIPWFIGETAAAPVLMLFQGPFNQVTTQRLGHDPNYLGHLSSDGAIVPSPPPGVVKWDYPFLRVNPNEPATTTQPAATQPIAPTPGISPAPPATEPSQVHDVETKVPQAVPGLR